MPNGGLSHTTNAPRARSGGAPRAPGRLGGARGCVRTAQEHGGHSRHGTRFETMAILVKALKCVTKRLRAFP